MKNLKIKAVVKDPTSITAQGDYKLHIKFEVTGTDGSSKSKVLIIGEYRKPGSAPDSPGVPIYSNKIELPAGAEPLWTVIPFDNHYIPDGAEVSIWGVVDTDFIPYTGY